MSHDLIQTIDHLSEDLEGEGRALLPLPADLLATHTATQLSDEVKQALRDLVNLPLNTPPDQAVFAFDHALNILKGEGFALTEDTGRAEKFDTFDAYFKIERTNEDPGRAYLYGLLASFRNMYAALDPEGTLTVTEIPLLRIALESALEMFEF